MALVTSFSGIATGIDTDALVKAVMAQEGRSLDRLNTQQTKNKAKSTAITNLKAGINNLNTSLAALQDKLNTGDTTAITTAFQDVISKFNAVQKIYKDGSTITRGSDGGIVKGPLADDISLKKIMSDMKTMFSNSKTTTSTYTNPASIGIKTGADGNLSVDTAAVQSALAADSTAVKAIGSFSELRTAVSSYTASTTGAPLLAAQQLIENQNKNLSLQISSTLSKLATREKTLRAQFSKMEVIIAQMKAASSSLMGM